MLQAVYATMWACVCVPVGASGEGQNFCEYLVGHGYDFHYF